MNKRKFKKKKAKEREKKVKVARQRDRLRKSAKERRKLEVAVAAEQKLARPNKPYISPEKHAARVDAKDDAIKEQLERNLKILEALEEEYLKEQEAREKLNDELESKGLHTLEDKIKYLGEKAQEENLKNK